MEKMYLKKIKHWKEEYERDESGFIRYESKTERNLCLDLVQCLNDEVEIIEEQQDIDIQKIEEIDEQFSLKYINSGLKKETEKALDDVINNIYIKTNELIQAVKQLDKKIKDKE